MPLPILETPNYELMLPSTGKKIKYRPFLVKEYKILLTTMEAESKEISRIVTELVDNCTFKKLDIDKLASFDIEYLFLNLFILKTLQNLLDFQILQFSRYNFKYIGYWINIFLIQN